MANLSLKHGRRITWNLSERRVAEVRNDSSTESEGAPQRNHLALKFEAVRYLKIGAAVRYKPEDISGWLESRPSGGEKPQA